MEFKIECPWCNQHYSVDESFVGQNVKCSVCGKAFKVNYSYDNIDNPSLKKQNYFSHTQQEKTNKANVSQDYIPQNKNSKGFIILFTLIIISVLCCVFYYIKVVKPKDDYKKGFEAYQEHHYTEAVNYLQKSAGSGFPEAQLLLGLCYINGDGISKNTDEALNLFRKSAEQNNPDAQHRLGLCYLIGLGVTQREEEAVYWLQKAADQGHKGAQKSLGDLYYNKADRKGFFSDEGKSNLSKAIKWYQQAGAEGEIWKCQIYLE